MGLQLARVKSMLATETTQNFHSHKKRKEMEGRLGGEKVDNLRSDRQFSISYMKGPDERASPKVGILKLQFFSKVAFNASIKASKSRNIYLVPARTCIQISHTERM